MKIAGWLLIGWAVLASFRVASGPPNATTANLAFIAALVLPGGVLILLGTRRARRRGKG